jgi:hypothetical protein
MKINSISAVFVLIALSAMPGVARYRAASGPGFPAGQPCWGGDSDRILDSTWETMICGQKRPYDLVEFSHPVATARGSVTARLLIASAEARLSHYVPSSETDVRSVVEKVFQSLKDKNYSALYDTLPAGTRSRLTRERFASALRRTQDAYALDHMEVGKVKVSGNIAMVDTVLYGRLLKPFDTEGKIVVQQYLVKEDGSWKVATGDTATINRFLAANPAFARQFRIRPPRIFAKKDGAWVEFTPPRRPRQ